MFGRITYRLLGAACLVVLLGPSAASAQHGTLFGHISDAEGSAVPGAHVVVQGTALGDAASTDGSYLIPGIPAGMHWVRVSAVGYATVRRDVEISVGDSMRLDVTIADVTVESDEVIVTAARRAQTTDGVAASVSTLTAREITMRNTLALDDALRHVSGVQVAGNQINIRGSSGFSYNTGSRVLLLVDGMPMLRPDTEGVPFDAVPIHQIQRIEVLKGPASALYGGGALGGIIHVITKTYPDEPQTFVEIYGGAYDPPRYAVWRRQWDGAAAPRPLGGLTVGHGRPLGERVGMWTNVTYRYDAGHLNMNRRRSVQAFSKLTWRRASDARLDVLLGANRRKSDSFLFWNGARDALNPGSIEVGRATVGTGSDDNLINEMTFQPSYSDVLTSDLLLGVRARFIGVLVQALDEELQPKPLAEGTIGFRYGGEVQLDYEPASRRRFIAGLSADANATRSGFFDTDDRLSQPEAAVFGQWEETVGGSTRLTTGVRFDTYRIRAGHVERKVSPRLSVSVPLAFEWSMRLAYGEGFRVPSVAERFVENSDYLPVVSNVDLLPETSRSYEVGVHGAGRAPRTRFQYRLDAAAFWSDYRRLIEPTFLASRRAFQFVNLTRARIRGAELTAALSTPSERTELGIGYTLLDARDLSLDQPLFFRSRHAVKATASTRLGPVELGADLRWTARPERVDSDFARFVRDAEMIGPTRVLDLRAASKWRGVRAALHVKNALDYYYLERPALLAPYRHVVLQISTTF
ncbi:MAG: TonB-dependent receptor [Rhodothermales bacterium]